jgi:O-antigen ligase
MPPPIDVMSIADTTSIERAKLWRVALAMFIDHPITGVGPDGFRNLYGRYAGVKDWKKNIYTNNSYIEMFTNLGLLGGLSFLWLAGLSLWNCGSRILDIGSNRSALLNRSSSVWFLGVGATASLVAFFAHGMVDYFLFSTPIYVIFWFLLAASARWHEA